MDRIAFTKMHGLGNDFVVIDARRRHLELTPAQARAIADRHTGVGCDQVIVIEPPVGIGAAGLMRIHNADGGEVAACGNAARCVAWLMMREAARDQVTLATAAGALVAELAGPRLVTVDMGRPRLGWRDIPLAQEEDTLHLPIAAGPLIDPVAVGMGNPHAVFFVADAEAVELASLGPALEHHALFPERANIGVAQVLAPDRLRLRVWERGAGLTMACGTGACAAVVAGNRRGVLGRAVEIRLDGGSLAIVWRDDDHVTMTGPVAVSFTGEIDASLLP